MLLESASQVPVLCKRAVLAGVAGQTELMVIAMVVMVMATVLVGVMITLFLHRQGASERVSG